MNSQHPNIKLTVETNPTTFLGRAFSKNPDGSFTIVFRKPGKLPSFWNSQIPKRYKWNNIQGGLHGAFKIAADFDAQVQTIIRKYLEVGYPIGFIESVINDYKNSKEEEQLIITEWLFDQRKKGFCLSCLIVPVIKEMSRVFPMENQNLLFYGLPGT